MAMTMRMAMRMPMIVTVRVAMTVRAMRMLMRGHAILQNRVATLSSARAPDKARARLRWGMAIGRPAPLPGARRSGYTGAQQ